MCQLWFQALFLRAVKYDISCVPGEKNSQMGFSNRKLEG